MLQPRDVAAWRADLARVALPADRPGDGGLGNSGSMAPGVTAGSGTLPRAHVPVGCMSNAITTAAFHIRARRSIPTTMRHEHATGKKSCCWNPPSAPSTAGALSGMPDASTELRIACEEMFSDRDATTAKVKALALSTEGTGKVEQVRAAEMRAALDWLYECLISGNGAGNGKRLSQSEDISMRELQRPSNLGADIQTHAGARYVLAVIAHMRGEAEVSASNIAHMAATAPRWFRAEFPALFERVFVPECKAAYEQLEAEMEGTSVKSYRARIMAQRIAAVAVGTGVGVTIVGGLVLAGLMKGGGSPPVIGQAIDGAAKPIWDSATRENARLADLGRIQARFEQRLDEECRAAARRLL